MIAGLGPALSTYSSMYGTALNGPSATQGAAKVAGAAGEDTVSFSDALKSAVGSVDSLQKNADQQITSMLTGTGDADLNKVTVSVEKADVAFQLMMQVRNKVVNAYQEMEKMQF